MGSNFRGLLKRIALGILIGLWILSYFFYVDFEKRCVVPLRPGILSVIEFNHKNIKEGLRVLKYNTPDAYNAVCNDIDAIVSDMGCGGWQGGCHYGKEGEITLSTAHNEFIGWTASVIAHELCHDIQLREGRPFNEQECYQYDHDVLQSVVEVYP